MVICDVWTCVEIFALKDWNFEYLSPSSIFHTSMFLLILETAAIPYFPPRYFKLWSDPQWICRFLFFKFSIFSIFFNFGVIDPQRIYIAAIFTSFRASSDFKLKFLGRLERFLKINAKEDLKGWEMWLKLLLNIFVFFISLMEKIFWEKWGKKWMEIGVI